MKPSEAAKLIGCRVRWLRTLIRRGEFPSTRKIPTPEHTPGYVYDLDPNEVIQYRDKSRGPGRPRSSKKGLTE